MVPEERNNVPLTVANLGLKYLMMNIKSHNSGEVQKALGLEFEISDRR